MDALAYSYGVTRGRGMTQCISASLLALDRWSLPNVTVRSSILGRKLANFMSLSILAGVLLKNSKHNKLNIGIKCKKKKGGGSEALAWLRFQTTSGLFDCKRPKGFYDSGDVTWDLCMSQFCFMGLLRGGWLRSVWSLLRLCLKISQ